MERVRHGAGILIAAGALVILYYAVELLAARDYLGCVILVLTGLSLLRTGTELVRPCESA